MIALDTTCLAGGADGCLDEDQALWLEDRLAEVHAAVRARDGTPCGPATRTGSSCCSPTTASTPSPAPRRTPGPRAAGCWAGPDCCGSCTASANVVLWLNGHTHTNTVRARPHPDDAGRGFWEVTTCAVVDWPCQTRIVELLDDADGPLSIACTMVDHDSPLGVSGPAADYSGADIAALHRELAGNVPWAGFDSDARRHPVRPQRRAAPARPLPAAGALTRSGRFGASPCIGVRRAGRCSCSPPADQRTADDDVGSTRSHPPVPGPGRRPAARRRGHCRRSAVYGRVHEPAGRPLFTLGFSGMLQMKVWLSTAALLFILVQLVTALWMWGRLPGAGSAPDWVRARPPVERVDRLRPHHPGRVPLHLGAGSGHHGRAGAGAQHRRLRVLRRVRGEDARPARCAACRDGCCRSWAGRCSAPWCWPG